jgi:hypothetical protein
MLNNHQQDTSSILDRYLANLSVEVEPFALCMLQSGWRPGCWPAAPGRWNELENTAAFPVAAIFHMRLKNTLGCRRPSFAVSSLSAPAVR